MHPHIDQMNETPSGDHGPATLPSPADVRENTARHRFELDVGGTTAFAVYRRAAGTIIITHTETPPALRGRGIASQLVEGALGLIRAEGGKVVAGCSFVADYLARHPQWRDVVADDR